MGAAVTVIIPTYNWSAALRCAITSVLAQTYRDFELLVIGDCCTDDSEDVAASFGDSRVRWVNLPVRHRTQSGPNNFGIGIASGGFIAYLGHDDLWHPEHLRLVVETIEVSGADIACGACVMYGPSGSGVRLLTGFFPEGRYRRSDFLPPSSLLHRRDLTARIGPWGRPGELRAPVDVDLLVRAWAGGARFASTERLTVFKFNSAWRRDSYRRQDAAEQQAMLDRLMADPAGCVEQEYAALLRARREHRLLDAVIPDRFDASPGEIQSSYMRVRGLETGETTDLTELRRFSLDSQDNALDWHGVERSADWGTFRWSGPSPTATLTLPVRAPRRFRVRLQVLNLLGAALADEVGLVVAGETVAFECREAQSPAVCLEAEVSRAESGEGPLRIQVTVARLRCPFFETDGKSTDTRWLGVCVNWVEVEPVTED